MENQFAPFISFLIPLRWHSVFGSIDFINANCEWWIFLHCFFRRRMNICFVSYALWRRKNLISFRAIFYRSILFINSLEWPIEVVSFVRSFDLLYRITEALNTKRPFHVNDKFLRIQWILVLLSSPHATPDTMCKNIPFSIVLFLWSKIQIFKTTSINEWNKGDGSIKTSHMESMLDEMKKDEEAKWQKKTQIRDVFLFGTAASVGIDSQRKRNKPTWILCEKKRITQLTSTEYGGPFLFTIYLPMKWTMWTSRRAVFFFL